MSKQNNRRQEQVECFEADGAENMVYQGGDDCIALKPNSTDITIRNVTCFGGTGIAFGSIAQYEGVVRRPPHLLQMWTKTD